MHTLFAMVLLCHLNFNIKSFLFTQEHSIIALHQHFIASKAISIIKELLWIITTIVRKFNLGSEL